MTKRPRRMPTEREMKCALILKLLNVPFETAKNMSLKQIERFVSADHYPVAYNTARDLGWTSEATNHPSNIDIVTHAENLRLNNKRDTPAAAKGRRLTKRHELYRRRMLARTAPDVDEPAEKRKRNWPKQSIAPRPFPKQKRPLR